jgi:hypothetical protein
MKELKDLDEEQLDREIKVMFNITVIARELGLKPTIVYRSLCNPRADEVLKSLRNYNVPLKKVRIRIKELAYEVKE